MTKTDSVELFEGVANLAEALTITRQAIYQWPEELAQRTADEVIGAAWRLGLKLPEQPEPA